MLELPWWFSGKESSCQYRRHKRPMFNPWVRKIPWKRIENMSDGAWHLNFHGDSGQGGPYLEGDNWTWTQKKWGWLSWGCEDPSRRASQWKDLGKALQGDWWDSSKRRTIEEKIRWDWKADHTEPCGHLKWFWLCSVWNGKPFRGSKQKDDSNLLKF